MFKDPNVLRGMLEKYLDGWSTAALGNFYGVDHTTIIFHTKKHLTLEERNRSRGDITMSGHDYKAIALARFHDYKKKYPNPMFGEEVINRGKLSYREYVMKDRERVDKIVHERRTHGTN